MEVGDRNATVAFDGRVVHICMKDFEELIAFGSGRACPEIGHTLVNGLRVETGTE